MRKNGAGPIETSLIVMEGAYRQILLVFQAACRFRPLQHARATKKESGTGVPPVCEAGVAVQNRVRIAKASSACTAGTAMPPSRGFSLVELMVSMAIVSVLGAIVFVAAKQAWRDGVG